MIFFKFMRFPYVVVIEILFMCCCSIASSIENKHVDNSVRQAKKIAVVYVSPSNVHMESSFGHSFLVIYEGEYPDFFSTTISFGGSTENLTRGETIVRGLSGTLDGYFRKQYFYEKFVEYSLVESRAMTFFEFKDGAINIDRLAEFSVKLRHSNFNYSFNKFNCTHGIDSLLYSFSQEPPDGNSNIVSPQGLIFKYRKFYQREYVLQSKHFELIDKYKVLDPHDKYLHKEEIKSLNFSGNFNTKYEINSESTLSETEIFYFRTGKSNVTKYQISNGNNLMPVFRPRESNVIPNSRIGAQVNEEIVNVYFFPVYNDYYSSQFSDSLSKFNIGMVKYYKDESNEGVKLGLFDILTSGVSSEYVFQPTYSTRALISHADHITTSTFSFGTGITIRFNKFTFLNSSWELNAESGKKLNAFQVIQLKEQVNSIFSFFAFAKLSLFENLPNEYGASTIVRSSDSSEIVFGYDNSQIFFGSNYYF